MDKLIYRPMERQEFEKHIVSDLEAYIKDILVYEEEFIKHMGRTPREFAEKQFGESLPDGVKSTDNFFWMAVNKENGEEIGYFWFTVIPDKSLCLLSQIRVFEQFHGLGYGSEILHFWEKYVAKTHPEIKQLYLHVFKHNPRAKKLYEKFGFTVFYDSFEGCNLIKPIKKE